MYNNNNIRFMKSLNDKIYLLSAKQSENNKEWNFRVQGQSKNIYNQTLTSTNYICSCPDHMGKKTFCKHLLFLVVKVAKQIDVGEYLSENPKQYWNNITYELCYQSWILNLEHLIKEKTNYKEDSDNTCLICYEELGKTNLIECKTICHKRYHYNCIKKWLTHGSSCPNCRTKWYNITNADIFDDNDVEITLNNNNIIVIDDNNSNNEIVIDNNKYIEIKIKDDKNILLTMSIGYSKYIVREIKNRLEEIINNLYNNIKNLKIEITMNYEKDGKKCHEKLEFTNNLSELNKFIKKIKISKLK